VSSGVVFVFGFAFEPTAKYEHEDEHDIVVSFGISQ